MKKDVLIILIAVAIVAIVVMVAVDAAIQELRVSCEQGETDPALCKMAELAGLFEEEPPADDVNVSP